MNYKVTWQIDVEAGNPVEAAEIALAVQRNPESIANVFEVKGQEVIPVYVDLQAVSEARAKELAQINGHGQGKAQAHGRWTEN